jgi:thioredoxin 1
MKLLKFYATWCAPCKGLTFVIDGVKDQLDTTIIDVDIEDNIELAQKYGVRTVPTLVLLDNKETVIKKSTGMLTEQQFLEFMEQ